MNDFEENSEENWKENAGNGEEWKEGRGRQTIIAKKGRKKGENIETKGENRKMKMVYKWFGKEKQKFSFFPSKNVFFLPSIFGSLDLIWKMDECCNNLPQLHLLHQPFPSSFPNF